MLAKGSHFSKLGKNLNSLYSCRPMQTTAIQVFKPSDLQDPNLTIPLFRTKLGQNKLFAIEGISRSYNHHILDKIDSLKLLIPTLTIKHGENSYIVSRELLNRVSKRFRKLSGDQGGVTETKVMDVVSTISKKGLELIIDCAQGHRVSLRDLNIDDFEKVLVDAKSFKVDKIQDLASKIIHKKALSLSIPELIEYTHRILNFSSFFNSLFGDLFSIHLQKMLMRAAQYEFDSDENNLLNTLLTFLSKSKLPLRLDLRHWTPDVRLSGQFKNLNIKELDLRFCTSFIDLETFDKLTKFRGSTANYSDFNVFERLEEIDLDKMPPSLPPNLKKLHLRSVNPSLQDLTALKNLKEVTFGQYMDVTEVPSTAEFSNIRSAKLSSSSGEITPPNLIAITSQPLAQLSLNGISIGSHVQPHAFEILQAASLTKCDSTTLKWVQSSKGPLISLRLHHQRIDEDTLNSFPVNLRELTLDIDVSAHLLTRLNHLIDLTSLHLHHIRWSDGGIAVLNGLVHLQHLSITVSGDFIPGDISPLTNLVNLRSLSVKSNSGWPTTTQELDILSRLPLTSLEITPTEELAEAGSLRELRRIRNLRKLSLFGTSKLARLRFVASLKELEELDLGGCRHLNQAELLRPLSRLPKLRYLHVSTILTFKEIRELFISIPSLERLEAIHAEEEDS